MNMKFRLMSRRMAPQKSGEGRNGRNSIGFKPFSSPNDYPILLTKLCSALHLDLVKQRLLTGVFCVVRRCALSVEEGRRGA